MQLFIKMRNNSKIFKRNVKVLIITSLTVKSLTQFIIKLMYFSKKKKFKLNESIKNTEKSKSFNFNNSLKINSLLMKN